MNVNWRRPCCAVGVLGFVVILGACGSDSDSSSAPRSSSAPSAQQTSSTQTTEAPQANACPIEGCKAQIVSVARAGGELRLRLKANYAADVSRNHYHVYWDTFTSKQVSDDAQQRFGVKPGTWVATADNPFTTSGDVSVKTRKGSKRVCVTAGDRYHRVIDPALFECRDVGALL